MENNKRRKGRPKGTTEKVVRYDITCLPSLMNEFEEAIKDDYDNRSVALRDLMKKYIRSKRNMEDINE